MANQYRNPRQCRRSSHNASVYLNTRKNLVRVERKEQVVNLSPVGRGTGIFTLWRINTVTRAYAEDFRPMRSIHLNTWHMGWNQLPCDKMTFVNGFAG